MTMKIIENENALKGHQISAQGFDVSSVERQHPGFICEQWNRPRYIIYIREIHFSDEKDDLVFPEKDVYNSVRRE